MSIQKTSICKNIKNLKTTILVIESNKQIAEKLTHCLSEKKIDASVKSKNLKGKCNIKSHDLYIINSTDYDSKEKYQIIRKILQTNNQANIFLLNDAQEEMENINRSYQNLKHPLKRNVINTLLTCDESGLGLIIAEIENVENTKSKIFELWNKLEHIL